MTKTHIFNIHEGDKIYYCENNDFWNTLVELGTFVRVGYYNGGLGVYTKLDGVTKFTRLNTCYLMA